MSAYFTNSLTPPTGLGLLASLAAGFSRSGSARLGRSQKDGLPTCREGRCVTVQGHQLAHREGQPGRCPFQSGAAMDTKTRHLAFLAALSLFCAGIAWIMDHAVFGSTFFALGAVGIFGAAERYWR